MREQPHVEFKKSDLRMHAGHAHVTGKFVVMLGREKGWQGYVAQRS